MNFSETNTPLPAGATATTGPERAAAPLQVTATVNTFVSVPFSCWVGTVDNTPNPGTFHPGTPTVIDSVTVDPAAPNQVGCKIVNGTGKVSKAIKAPPLLNAPKKVTTTVKLTGTLVACGDGYGLIALPKGPITNGTFKVTLKSVTNVGDNGPDCSFMNQLAGKSSLKFQLMTFPGPPKPKFKTVTTEKANLTSGGTVNISTDAFDLSGLSANTKPPMAGQTETVHGDISPSTLAQCASAGGLKTFAWSGTYHLG